MKKIPALLMSTCLMALYILSVGLADEQIDSRYMAILDAWDATSGEELWHNTLDCWWERNKSEAEKDDPAPSWPLNICFGATTEQLVAEQKDWDLALVSSKEVDLQQLADEGLIMCSGYVPCDHTATSQWLYPSQIQRLLPIHPILMYKVYCYEYDPQTNDALLLICQADIGAKKSNPRFPDLCAQEILDRRTVDQVRAMEGIARVSWTTDELLNRDDEWDTATLWIESVDDLATLDEAGLLYDFSNDPYWLSREMDWPVPEGVYNAEGRLIAIPFISFGPFEPGPYRVAVINAHGVDISRALAYEKHLIKSYEWLYNHNTPSEILDKYGISIYKDQVTW